MIFENVGSVVVTCVCDSAAGAGAFRLVICLLQRRGCKGSARGRERVWVEKYKSMLPIIFPCKAVSVVLANGGAST